MNLGLGKVVEIYSLAVSPHNLIQLREAAKKKSGHSPGVDPTATKNASFKKSL